MVANNRMFLVHPESGEKIYLAKYYPSTGWYVDTSIEAINKAFNRSDFGSDDWPNGEQGKPKQTAAGGLCGTVWKIEYEAEP